MPAIDKHQAPMSEFLRLVPVDELQDGAATTVSLSATGEERAALARRFGLMVLTRFDVEAVLRKVGETVRAEIALSADVVQACVVTLEPVSATIEDNLIATFDPRVAEAEREVEVSIAAEDPPEPMRDGAIELGEVASEALGLALDPYPRKPDANFEGWSDRDETVAGGPFATLARFRE